MPDILTSTEQISEPLLAKYADMVYERTGIRVSPQKKMMFSNRLRRRLKETGIASFEDYLEHLKKLRPTHAEWDAFLQEVTTHETYLFRDQAHWNWFKDQFLPQHLTNAQGPAGRSLRVWSAAASTGDEAATIACCIASAIPNLSQWRVHILGTDIGVGALEQARNAVFGERQMRLVSEEDQRRFFRKLDNASVWQLRPTLLQMMVFRQHNLMEALKEQPFDVVFLKNVLIYFDQESKKQVLKHVNNVLRPGGYLICGAAEGVSDLIRNDLKRIEPWLYQRTAGAANERNPVPATR